MIAIQSPFDTHARYIGFLIEHYAGNFPLWLDPIKAKIADAEQTKVHTMLVIGQRELESDSVAVRLHGKGNVGVKPSSEALADILAGIKERSA